MNSVFKPIHIRYKWKKVILNDQMPYEWPKAGGRPWVRPTISRRAIPPKYFENIFKTNDSVGVTRQQTWLRNEEIAEYFGENLDILTDLKMDTQ